MADDTAETSTQAQAQAQVLRDLNATAMAKAQLRDAQRLSSRLSLPVEQRIWLAVAGSCLAGMTMGIPHGSKETGLRFRAENAHRLPSTPDGWYLYHKAKNYSMTAAGVRAGITMSSKLSVMSGGFLYVEDMLDAHRRSQDFLNSLVASLSVAGAFSLWNQFPLSTTARTAKTALLFGLGYGLLQDALGMARGRTPGYVDFALRRGPGRGPGRATADEGHNAAAKPSA